ncbi:hypothetical protein BN946_scf184799.g21 [Trametes cinnabarina]|uniref:DUF7918 domain-containing protein n=1 Tax=Pycnoporus cinnabarinus TaxID=5643 RepID=A0A060S7S3_PYCCI|nr:hypothetical protein BN946_scf184799.g21 [Trametes cinnabarina]
MLEHRGFSAWITSEDMGLMEFEPRVDEKNHTVTCWIAGPVGKTFVVHWRDHGSQVDSASYIYFDGFKVSGQFLYGSGEELRRGVRVGPQEERPFVFSKIAADDAVGFEDKATNKNVGSIILEIKQIKRDESYGPNKVREPPKVIRGHRQEGDVCVRYGDTRPAPMQKPTWKIKPYDPNNRGPFVTFVFRYRSQDWLVSQGIINPEDDVFGKPPTPLPLEPTPLMTPTTEQLGLAELEPEDDEMDSPYASLPASPRSPEDTLGLTGIRPPGNRTVSDNSARSFSGTWDPTSSSGHYEAITWDEYRPEDEQELDDYYS